MAEIRTVTVLGTGVLGSQIAFQTAYSGFDVVAYDISDEILVTAAKRFDALVDTFTKDVAGAAGAPVAAARARIRLSSDLADAVADADLVIEAVPENIDLKRSVYEKLAAVAPEKTIFATNTSSLLPSQLSDATGRPDRFIALHFANLVWVHNTAEIMGTPQTSPEVYQRVVDFAKAIGMVPLELKKEQPGYLLNSLLIPLLTASAGLLLNGIAEKEMIDEAWRVGTGAEYGPFQIYDIVGLHTAYDIALMGGPASAPWAEYLKTNYIDKGKLGLETGEGFYTYPASS